MAYIGFGLVMAGLVAAGVAIDMGISLATAIDMTAAGAALMWLFREEDEDGEKEDSGAASCSGHVDKHAGKGGGGYTADQQCGGGRDIPGTDHGVPSRDSDCNGMQAQTGDLRRAGRMDR